MKLKPNGARNNRQVARARSNAWPGGKKAAVQVRLMRLGFDVDTDPSHAHYFSIIIEIDAQSHNVSPDTALRFARAYERRLISGAAESAQKIAAIWEACT